MRYRFLLILIICIPTISWSQKKIDLIIENGRIVDGSGNPWYYGAIGIQDGEIVVVGDARNFTAKRTIDAQNAVIAPGFIDVHTHIEESILARPGMENFAFDGVTSVVTGNSGNSRTDLKKFFNELESNGFAINVASLIGHNAIRSSVMGNANRPPRNEELVKMKSLVSQAMRNGAVGFSTGLMEVPGTYSETVELIALTKEVAKYNGIYVSDIRNASSKIIDALEEAAKIGREAKIPVQISQFKLVSKSMWNNSRLTIGMVKNYRSQGIDMTVDQFPYVASNARLAITVPPWTLVGGVDSLNSRLSDPAIRQHIEKGMKEILAQIGQTDYQYAAIADCPWEPAYSGKRIPKVAEIQIGKNDLDAQITTILEMIGRGAPIQMVFHTMNETDVQRIMKYANTMIASGAGIPKFKEGVPHPRAYGTNARVIGRYVRDLDLLELEDAVRKMTSLPAQRFQFKKRGLLKTGMAADIVVFDPGQIGAKATFKAPHAYAAGIHYVLVNGQILVEKGKHTGVMAGKVLRRSSKH